jgi:hypothetical protein
MNKILLIVIVSLLAPLAALHAGEPPRPPAVPTRETRKKIEAQREKIATLPVPILILLGTVELMKPWNGNPDQMSADETIAF